jgi:hypothetical protein
MGNPLHAAAKARFESFIRQMRYHSRVSIDRNRHIVSLIVAASVLQYPQSYISKLWRAGCMCVVMEIIYRVQKHDLSMEQASILFQQEAKQKTNINISFNRDTVSERHCLDLGYLLLRLEQDH